MAYGTAFYPPYPINALIAILSGDLAILPKWLPTLIDNLLKTVAGQQTNVEQILRYKQQITEFQKSSQIGENIDSTIEHHIKQLADSYTAAYKEVCHLIEYGSNLHTVFDQRSSCPVWDPAIPQQLRNIFSDIIQLQRRLIANSLLITSQPGPIIQKDKLIETEFRLLIDAGSIPNIQQLPVVRCRIIDSASAEALQSGKIAYNNLPVQGRIENNETPLVVKDGTLVGQKYDEKEKHLLLKDIGTRKKTKGTERVLVTELKCVILYEMVATEPLRRMLNYTETIWVTSLPIILITHPKQMIDALSTIVWDRTFGSKKEVEWSSLAELLKKSFACMTRSKRSLSENDLEYLRKKLSGNGKTFTYAQFAKDKIGPEGKFTFWTYFYSICDVIDKKLNQYWSKGYIMGLSSKDESSQKLTRLEKPAFLLRFSDSQLGNIAVTYFKNNSSGVKQFLLPAMQPEKAHTLVELLRGFSQLNYIRYLCKENYELMDKGLFLDDNDLAAEDKDENIVVNGYHKVRLAFALCTNDDDDDDDEEKEVSNEQPETPDATGHYEEVYPVQQQPYTSPSNDYCSPSSSSNLNSPLENTDALRSHPESPTYLQFDFGISQPEYGLQQQAQQPYAAPPTVPRLRYEFNIEPEPVQPRRHANYVMTTECFQGNKFDEIDMAELDEILTGCK